MEKLSALTRTELIGELLATIVAADDPHACQVHDVESPNFGRPEAADERREALVAQRLAIARELMLRDMRAKLASGPVMSSPQVLREWLVFHTAGLEHEVFIVLFLDVRMQLLSVVEMFRGTLTQTTVYPREIAKAALKRNAAAVVLAHNHPSGSAEPSAIDQHLTRIVKAALDVLSVQVIDHYVVAGDRVVSLAERGLI